MPYETKTETSLQEVLLEVRDLLREIRQLLTDAPRVQIVRIIREEVIQEPPSTTPYPSPYPYYYWVGISTTSSTESSI